MSDLGCAPDMRKIAAIVAGLDLELIDPLSLPSDWSRLSSQ
jgi:hypothetical protein